MSNISLCEAIPECVNPDFLVVRHIEDSVFSCVCDCPGLYGWKGEICDERSILLIFSITFSSISIVWNIILILLVLRTILLTCVLEGFSTNSLALTSYCLLTASVLFSPRGLLELRAMINPKNLDRVEYKSPTLDVTIETIDARGSLVGYVTSLFAYIAGIFALLFLVLSWHEVITRVYTFYSPAAKVVAHRRKNILQLSAVLSTLILVILISIQDLFGAAFFVGVASIGGVSFVASVSHNFVHVLDTISNENAGNALLIRTTRFIRKVRTLIIVCFLLLASSVVLSFILLRIFDNDGRAAGVVTLLIGNTFVFSSLFLLSILGWYINSVSVGPIVSEFYPVSLCRMFHTWDKMNKRLIPEVIATQDVI